VSVPSAERLFKPDEPAMRRYRKLRALSIVSLTLSICLFLASLLCFWSYHGYQMGLDCGGGVLEITVMSGPTIHLSPVPSWTVGALPTYFPLGWLPKLSKKAVPISGFWVIQVAIPLWIPMVISAVAAFFFHRIGKPTAIGHCAKCGYNLKGNTSGVCPECGSPIELASRRVADT
jgi:hypothetical protein